MNRTWSLPLLALVVLVGCSRPVETPAQLESEQNQPVEPDFAAQVATVKAGQSDRIQIEAQPISDEELQSLAGLENLEVLILDYPTNAITREGFATLGQLPKLMHLRLRGVKVDDESAEHLAKATGLQVLNLPQSDVTDAGMEKLASLQNLVQLRIGSSQLTDAGLESLKQLPKLKRVHLIAVPLTDKGLAVFHDLPKLESLYIDGAKLSDAAYERLFAAKPELHVHVDQAHHDRDPHAHPH